MKYLDMLKEEIQLHDDQENPKNTHPELPQKPQKGLYGVFGVQQGSTFSEKKALGYGCTGCGNKIYQAVEVWETREILGPSEFKHEHVQVTHWQCDGCGAVFEIIGGSCGPQFLN